MSIRSIAPTRLRGRVFVIGDVHAEHEVLLSALDYAHAMGARQILCVGDIADGAGELARCCSLLASRGVFCVRGNHDDWALNEHNRELEHASVLDEASRAFLQALPGTRLFASKLGGVLLAHGVAGDDMAKFDSEDSEVEFRWPWERWAELAEHPSVYMHIGGHTHEAMIRRMTGAGLPGWSLNAGTLRVRSDRPSKLLEIDFRRARTAIHERVDGAWQSGEYVDISEGGARRERSKTLKIQDS